MTSTAGTATRAAAPEPLCHPGPVLPDRVVSLETRLVTHEVELPAGARLLDALGDVLDRFCAAGAVGRLVGGSLAEFDYYIPALGPPGGSVATFSEPIPGGRNGRLRLGGVTLGHRDGEVFAHSHALFDTALGERRAGHLIPDSVVLGRGVTAHVAVSADVRYDVAHDPETTMSLFEPRRVVPGPADRGEPIGRRAIVCRVRPNVDLPTTIERLTEQQGWTGARVHGQIGSIVGGRLRQPDGSILVVEGPATEVMYLDGEVRRVDGRMTADLMAGLVDRFGGIHHGGLVRGMNPVAMTYELALAESDPIG
ncbi:hypothetical protein [Nocardioides sp. Soil796]|uniref:hypothetical protein n=1 Tax=Nocardioides sp. Soil796 TaxID=1736412 RepID=UPI00070E7981|nr:hypothetical protein [Nocardioides sp. Soil796]KRF16890.1 hypothetical protein ASH02_02180 [Nocardioides sp. Soil796]